MGVAFLHVLSDETERTGLAYQKHYRSEFPHLLDPNRLVERSIHPRGGWPYYVIVDGDGKVVFAQSSTLRRLTQVPEILRKLAPEKAPATVTHAGTRYMATTGAARGLAKRRAEFRPTLVPDAGGHLLLVHVASGESGHEVRLRSAQMDSETTVVSAGCPDAFDATAVRDPAGRVWIVYTGLAKSGRYDVFVRCREKDGSLGEPVNLTGSDDDAMDPAATVAADGSVWVAYDRWRKMGTFSRDKEVYARRFDGKAWTPEMRLSPEDLPEYEDHSDPSIAPSGKDGVAVVWAWDMHRMRDPKYARYQSGFHAEAPTIFGRRASAAGPGDLLFLGHLGVDGTPRLLRDYDRRLHCAWRTLTYGSAGEQKALVASVLPAGAADRASQQVIETGRRDVAAPFLYLNNGRPHLVWSSQGDDGRWTIRRSALDKGEWSKPEVLVDEGDPREPSVAINAWCRVILAYVVEDGFDRRIVLKGIGVEYS